MSEPFLGEIIMFAGNFAPRGWALCDGQLLAISSNTALFSILGTTYGGDGRTTFALPDLRGRVPVHPGSGPGLTKRNLGQRGGSETNTLTSNQLPSHSHSVNAKNANGNSNVPAANHTLGAFGQSAPPSGIYSSDAPDTALLPSTIGNTGGGQSVNNMEPFECVNFIIALQGVFPSRN